MWHQILPAPSSSDLYFLQHHFSGCRDSNGYRCCTSLFNLLVLWAAIIDCDGCCVSSLALAKGLIGGFACYVGEIGELRVYSQDLVDLPPEYALSGYFLSLQAAVTVAVLREVAHVWFCCVIVRFDSRNPIIPSFVAEIFTEIVDVDVLNFKLIDVERAGIDQCETRKYIFELARSHKISSLSIKWLNTVSLHINEVHKARTRTWFWWNNVSNVTRSRAPIQSCTSGTTLSLRIAEWFNECQIIESPLHALCSKMDGMRFFVEQWWSTAGAQI
jgi:hypothetical protein